MSARTKQEILDDIRWHAEYFARCREIQQGIGSKDTVKMSRLILEATDAGATQAEIEGEYPESVRDMANFDYTLAQRNRDLLKTRGNS